jgi:hypothetical protein
VAACFLPVQTGAAQAASPVSDNPPGRGIIASGITSSEKGGFQYSEPPPWPEVELDLEPIQRQVAKAASTRCGTPLAAAPLDLGDADGFMKNVAGKAAGAAIGSLVGGFLGGGGRNKEPDLHKDPIKGRDKVRIDHPGGDARLRIGGRMYDDGMLVSARVDRARSKGTFHTMFLEKPDCSRIWPEQYLGYGLWGSWSLSVSVTKTTSSYRNGELVDRSIERSGWSKSGEFDFSKNFSLWDEVAGDEQLRLILDPDQAYLAQLRREIGTPAWQEMGYAEPTQGVREAGALFRVTPADLTPGTVAVVHVTHVEGGRYRTLGFPLTLSFADQGKLAFALVDTPHTP